ncbi:putative testis-expressed protein 13C [Phyllostomus discolor]|uniref:Testis-expressed protein 13C n=1 Tax=Phyllostomus discolor TaxID=89673 RepID=A0A7E6D1K5_9CHIR|nr:putative testis-expressed protein 13C [Phyllostomus discolor]
MAVNFGDFTSGFRHNEVVSFINNEVLSNGGGPDFYTNFRSQPWNEIEDQLRAVLTDPQVPHNLKRAYTWSALALSVRVAARQREQQVPQVRWLQQRVQEREATSWVLASQLQQLCKERDQVASSLQRALATLQETMDERDVLCHRLHQVQRSAQANLPPRAIKPVRREQQHGATAWPVSAEEQGEVVATGAHSIPHLETQMASLGTDLYMPRPSSAWAQAMHQPLPRPSLPRLPLTRLPLPRPVPHPFPVHAPFPMGFPYSTPLPPPPPPPPVVMEAEGAVAGMAAAAAGTGVPQIPPLGMYSPGLSTAVGTQEVMGPLTDQSSYGPCGYPETLQGGSSLGDSTDHSQDKDPVCSQKAYPVILQDKYPLGNSESHSQEGTVMPQGKNLLGNIKSHSLDKGPEMSQEMYPLGGSEIHSQEGLEMPQGRNLLGNSESHGQEGPVMPQGRNPLGNSKNHGQDGPVMPQGKYPMGNSKSHSQGGGPEMSQEMYPLAGSRSGAVRKCPKKQQPQGQKAGQPKGVRASEFMHQEVFASYYNLQNWYCPWCRAANFLWRKSCYKCKRVSMAFSSGGSDPRQTHFRKKLNLLEDFPKV